MVERHRPGRPEAIVVKRGRRRTVLRQERQHCVVCGATLRDDHALGDLVCDAHSGQDGNPRADAPTAMMLSAEERLLVMLYRAAGKPLNVYRAFGCSSTDTNCSAFRDMVQRLTASGLVRIRGHKRIGYELASQRGSGARR